MAKIVGVGTGISGKVGNVQYKTVKGTQILQTKSTPHNTRSTSQITNRSVFGQLNTLFKPLSGSLIKQFWNPYVIGKRSGWSEILSFNQKLQPGPDIDLSKLHITRGSLPLSTIILFSYVPRSGGTTVRWSLFLPSGSSLSDISHCYIYHIPTDSWFSPSALFTRGDFVLGFDLPQNLIQSDLRCYLFFSSPSITQKKNILVSDSSFMSG